MRKNEMESYFPFVLSLSQVYQGDEKKLVFLVFVIYGYVFHRVVQHCSQLYVQRVKFINRKLEHDKTRKCKIRFVAVCFEQNLRNKWKSQFSRNYKQRNNDTFQLDDHERTISITHTHAHRYFRKRSCLSTRFLFVATLFSFNFIQPWFLTSTFNEMDARTKDSSPFESVSSLIRYHTSEKKSL